MICGCGKDSCGWCQMVKLRAKVIATVIPKCATCGWPKENHNDGAAYAGWPPCSQFKSLPTHEEPRR